MLVAVKGPRPAAPTDDSAPKTSFCERVAESVDTYRDSGRLLAGGGGGGLVERLAAVFDLASSLGFAVYSLDRMSSLLLPSPMSTTMVVSLLVVSLLVVSPVKADEPVTSDAIVLPRLKRGSIPLRLDNELSEPFFDKRGALIASSSLDGLYRGPECTARAEDAGEGCLRNRMESSPICELPNKRTFRSVKLFTLLGLRFPPVF